MADIFLSYAREDRARARKFVDAFKNEGFSVWWDTGIKPGSTWRGTINKALRECHCMVVLWSPESVESAYVQEEAEKAKSRDVLFPVLIDNVEPPYGFGAIQCAVLTEWDGN